MSATATTTAKPKTTRFHVVLSAASEKVIEEKFKAYCDSKPPFVISREKFRTIYVEQEINKTFDGAKVTVVKW